jgi:hypothetical protein
MARKTKAREKPIIQAHTDPASVVPMTYATRPTDVDIQQRAYELYSARGGEMGHDLEDWLTAEKEIMPS